MVVVRPGYPIFGNRPVESQLVLGEYIRLRRAHVRINLVESLWAIAQEILPDKQPKPKGRRTPPRLGRSIVVIGALAPVLDSPIVTERAKGHAKQDQVGHTKFLRRHATQLGFC